MPQGLKTNSINSILGDFSSKNWISCGTSELLASTLGILQVEPLDHHSGTWIELISQPIWCPCTPLARYDTPHFWPTYLLSNDITGRSLISRSLALAISLHHPAGLSWNLAWGFSKVCASKVTVKLVRPPAEGSFGLLPVTGLLKRSGTETAWQRHWRMADYSLILVKKPRQDSSLRTFGIYLEQKAERRSCFSCFSSKKTPGASRIPMPQKLKPKKS